MLKTAYFCGPLTELDPSIQQQVKNFYSTVGDVCEDILGVRAFVLHEYFDPILHAHFTPRQVDEAERDRVCFKTNVLIVVAIEPTWGGGIEVEMANCHHVPILLLKPPKRVSRLLLGNPAIKQIVEYHDFEEALVILRKILPDCILAD